MASKKPHRGAITVGPTSVGSGLVTAVKGGTVKDGSWRPDAPYNSGDGLKVTLRREPGVTEKGFLRVPFRFQVPPIGDFSRAYKTTYATYGTLRLGKRPRLDGRELDEISFDTMFMDAAAANASSGLVVWNVVQDPQRMIRELRWLMGHIDDEPRIFRLTISQQAVWGNSPLVNMLAVLTAVSPTQKGDSIGTEYVSLSFMEWPEDLEAARKGQRAAKASATTHTLQKGDTLYEIAKKSHFKRASAWKTIAKANGITGVKAGSDEQLAKWAKRHNKKKLKIPAKASK